MLDAFRAADPIRNLSEAAIEIDVLQPCLIDGIDKRIPPLGGGAISHPSSGSDVRPPPSLCSCQPRPDLPPKMIYKTVAVGSDARFHQSSTPFC